MNHNVEPPRSAKFNSRRDNPAVTTPDVTVVDDGRGALAPILRSEVPPAYWETLAKLNFPMQALHELGKIDARRTLVHLGGTACSLAAVPLLYAEFRHPVILIFGCFLMIRTFNCLAQLVHTSDHGGLFRSSRLNRIAGNLCAMCLGYTRTGHRLTHLDHHRYLNTIKDPDRIWGAPDQSVRDLLRLWLRDFTFVSALERLLQYSESDMRVMAPVQWSRRLLLQRCVAMLPVVAMQLLILGYYSVVLGPGYYALLYLLPIFTVYPAQIRLRALVEHSFDVGYRPISAKDVWVSRTTEAKAIERFILSPFGIHYHFEHHLFPTIPHYNLGKVHRLLLQSGFPVPSYSSYVGFVLHKMIAERQR